MIDQVCMSCEFGNTQDSIHWTLTQNRKLVTYKQLKERETQPWLKDLTNLYDTQVSLGRAMTFGDKNMIEILQEKVKADSGVDHYYYPVDQNMVPGWDLEYSFNTNNCYVG